MTAIDINDFTDEKQCIYDGELYSVRDNGAVLRHQRIGKRTRSNDNQWTFGKENSQNPYLHLASVRIHRIVATAFHGEPLDPLNVVDHIDTNGRNNRPENLRWLTRLENALKNPITCRRIELICGSIEAFLENPSILRGLKGEPNFAWMRTVSLEEAKNCKERMLLWASTDKKPNGGSLGEWLYEPLKGSEILSRSALSVTETTTMSGLQIGQQVAHHQFGDGVVLQKSGQALQIKFSHTGVKWVHASYLGSKEDNCKESTPVFGNADMKSREGFLNESVYEPTKKSAIFDRESDLVMALTKGCAQYRWRVPSYFPCCPEEVGTNPLEAYFQNMRVGGVFSYNDVYPRSTILEFVKAKDNSSILVMCEKEEGLKPWSVAEVTFEDGLFVHSNLGSFFDKNGADKTFCIEQGLEWASGDTFDDFC